jgi:hypothetical protein
MAQITKLYVHRDRWDSISPEGIVPGVTIWCAHRPLRGELTWEQSNMGWGVHFAAHRQDREGYAAAEEANARDDAREVEVVTNLRVLELAQERNAAAGSSYGLDVYIGQLGPEGAREFAARWEFPWSDTDVTADALIASLMGGAA